MSQAKVGAAPLVSASTRSRVLEVVSTGRPETPSRNRSGVAKHRQLAAVVRVLVADHHGVEIGEGQVPLQP